MWTPAPRPLAGYRFIIIEDEMVQAWRLGDLIAELGGKVEKIAFNYDQGLQALMQINADCVVMDINLHGRLAFPLARELEEEGIPFVYCSAFADAFDVHPEVKSASCVSKPVTAEKLRDAVLLALGIRKRPCPQN